MKHLIILLLLAGCAPKGGSKAEKAPNIIVLPTILTINAPDLCDMLTMDIKINGEAIFWDTELTQSREVAPGTYIIEGHYYYVCEGQVNYGTHNFNRTVHVPLAGWTVDL